MDRQGEVTGLRPFSNTVTELAPGHSLPGFWRGTEFTKQQQQPGTILRKATASVTPLKFTHTRTYLVDAAATTKTPKADKYCCCISLFLMLFWLSSCKYFLNANKMGYPPKFRMDFCLRINTLDTPYDYSTFHWKDPGVLLQLFTRAAPRPVKLTNILTLASRRPGLNHIYWSSWFRNSSFQLLQIENQQCIQVKATFTDETKHSRGVYVPRDSRLSLPSPRLDHTTSQACRWHLYQQSFLRCLPPLHTPAASSRAVGLPIPPTPFS